MSNPITLLVDDHRRMEGLLSTFLEAEGSDRARALLEVSLALSAHLALEEEHFYPAVRARRTQDNLLEGLEEHLSLKRVTADLLELGIDDARWSAKAHVLAEQARHHHKEEEEHLFPEVERLFVPADLDALGDAMRSRLADLETEKPVQRVFAETDGAAPLSSSSIDALPTR